MSEEEQANPYNAKKSWHEDDAKTTSSADSLFFEEQEATSEDTGTPQEKRPRTNYKKRYDDLKKHYDQKISEFKQREQELEAMARSAQPQYQPPKSAEDLEKFKAEYPDLYDTVETVAHMRSEEQMTALQQKLSALEMREAEMSKRDAEMALRERHPDFEDIRGDDNFHEWAKTQPEEIQRWIYKNPDNVGLASRAIDLYKMENNIAIKKSSRHNFQSPMRLTWYQQRLPALSHAKPRFGHNGKLLPCLWMSMIVTKRKLIVPSKKDG